MIDLDLKSALALYSAILGLIVVTIWIYTELTVRRPQRFLGKQFLWRCSFCGYSYLDEQDETLSQCPRCQSYNSAQDREVRFVPVRQALQDTLRPPAVSSELRKNPSRKKRPHQRHRGPRRH